MQSDLDEAGGQIRVKGSPGCMILVALPFALTGVWSAADAVRAYREGGWGEAVPVGVFALAFCAVGFGIMIVPLYGARGAARARALDASRSGESWQESEDGSMARIDSDQTQGVRGAWALALFWNLFLSPVYVAFLVELWRGSRPGPVSLIVPLVGMGLIIRAALRGRGWGRSGASTFEVAESPATIGGRLVGRIVSDRMPAKGTSIRLRLTCLRHEGRRRGIERMIWETEKKVTAGDLRSTGGIPVDFDIPAHCEPTSADGSSRSRIKWVLQAQAAEPGASFAPRFDVPVLPTPAPAIAPAEDLGPGPG
jgi:hypothetical protein